MKKILGILLVLSPFIALGMILFSEGRFLDFIIALAISMLIVIVMVLGLCLIMGDI